MLRDFLWLKLDLPEHGASVFMTAIYALLCISQTNLKFSFHSKKFSGHSIDTFSMSAILKFLLPRDVEARLTDKGS